MAFWFWVVILSIVALGLYELYFRYKNKNNPPQEDLVVDEEAVAAVHAELARATMKIAVLQNRLEVSEAKAQEDAAALAALEERYQEQLEKTEKAYQRQMVTLSERLGSKKNGENGPKKDLVVEYPVRIAAEVAAWRASLGGQPLVETAVSEDLAVLAESFVENIEAQNLASDAISEETADPINGTAPAIVDEEAFDPEPLAEPAVLEDEVLLAAPLLEPEQAVLDQVVVLDEIVDEIPDEAVPAETTPVAEAGDIDEEEPFEMMPQVETGEIDEEEPFETMPQVEPGEIDEEEPFETTPVAEAGDIDEEEPFETTAQVEPGEIDEEEPFETTAVQEIPPLENRWPDLESIAMQRVMARQLASEMDADYLDYEEFLREMGIEADELPPEEPAERERWVTDPLQEMDTHINGSQQPSSDVDQDEAVAETTDSDPVQDITEQMWEEVIHGPGEPGGAFINETENDLTGDDQQASGAVDSAPPAEDAVLDFESEGEEGAIAATVATILSRAPEGDVEYFNEDLLQEADSGSGGREDDDDDFPAAEKEEFLAVVEDIDEAPPDSAPPDALAAEAAADEVTDADPFGTMAELVQEEAPEEEEPAFVWERRPVAWQAEYFDNTRLANEPALVRQDSDIDFEWLDKAPGPGLMPRTFSVRWSGNLTLEAGQYRFTASAPDGLRLWLNDRLVLSAWYDQSEQTYLREFTWPGGTMDVRLEHYENGGDAKAFLTWERVA